MFPSTGYFKAVTCPFFASGLCERQYCHFRHVKPTEPPPPPKDLASSEASVSNTSQNGQSLLSMVGKAVQHFQKDLEKNIGNVPKKKRKETSDVDPKMNKYLALIAGNDKYKMPETISIPKASVDPSPRAVDPSVPQYRPTPISQLKKKRHEPKYVIPYMEEDASESEYDPATNYSTEQRTKSPPEFEYKPTPLNKKTKIFAEQVAEDGYDPVAEYDPTSEYEPSGEYDPTAVYIPTELDICSEPEGNFSDDNDGATAAQKLQKGKKTGSSKTEIGAGKKVKEKVVEDDLVSQIIFASETTNSMSMSQVKKYSDGSIDFVNEKQIKKKTIKSSKEKVTEQKSEKGLFDLFKSEKKAVVKPTVSDKAKKCSDGVKTKVLERKDSGSRKHGDDRKKVKSVEGVAKSQSLKSESKDKLIIEKHHKKHSTHSDSPKSQEKDKRKLSTDNANSSDKNKSKTQTTSDHSGKSRHSHHRTDPHSPKPHSSKSSKEMENGAKKLVSSKHCGHGSSSSKAKGSKNSEHHKENLNSPKVKHRSESTGSYSHHQRENKSGSSESNHSTSKVQSPGSYFGFATDSAETAPQTKSESRKSHNITKTLSHSDWNGSMNETFGFDFHSDFHETRLDTKVEKLGNRVDKHRKSSTSVKSESSSKSKHRLSGGETHTFKSKHSCSTPTERLGSSKEIKYSISRRDSGTGVDLDESGGSDTLGEEELPTLQIGLDSPYKKFSWDDIGTCATTSHEKQYQGSKGKSNKSGKPRTKSVSESKDEFIILSSDDESPKKPVKRPRTMSSGSGSKSGKGSISTFDLFGDDSDNSSDESVNLNARQRSRSSETITYLRGSHASGDSRTGLSKSAKRRKTVEQSSSDSDGDNFMSLGNDQFDVQNNSDGSEASDARYAGSNGDGLELDLDDDDDGEDLYDECLKIFNESPKSKKHQVGKHGMKRKPQEEQAHSVSKANRTAHAGAEKVVKKKFQRTHVLSPAAVMHNRFVEMQKKLEEAREKRMDLMKDKKSVESPGARKVEERRGSSLLRKSSQSSPVVRRVSRDIPHPDEPEGPTRIQTIKSVKSGQRKAHVPKLEHVVETMKRPTIPPDLGGKVPTNVRQRYLNLFVDECLKIYDSQKDAFERALSEEKAVYTRSGSKNVYLNVAVNAIKKLRNESQASGEPVCSSPAKTSRALIHEYNLGGRKAMETSYTLHRSSAAKPKQVESFSASHLYHRLKPYILTEEQLQENGFPRVDEDSFNLIKFYNTPRKKSTGKALEKACTRCGKRFYIDPSGEWQTLDECIYHWGRAFKKRLCGSIESRYNCCDSDLTSRGCQVAKLHVYDSNVREVLSGYMKTLPCSPQYDEDYGVYALDCEMIYTTKGQELARVTVVDHRSETVYEALVQPEGDVIDYNTRFSGITEDDLKDVTTNLHDVQAVLLSLFNHKSILMGHSLESDLCALKLIHSTVVDTSVVFPHWLGPPYKRALRHLAGEILNKIIQNDVGGHDSREDAVSCLELMLWKVRDDIKKESR
ncbi:uncharacterized protein LOC135486691 isoform X2 [Lineus longissimus]|uniref:uncharacterized protein LOC135486691 isoform X2 n=1 Tax=Lineus longissimus TaxID=88925 RepID=UPI00315C5054